jgi:para-nitrobenzyl esterase
VSNAVKSRSWRLASAGLIATLLAACATSAPPATPAAADASLEGSSWRLVQIAMSDGLTRPAIERSRYTIGFGTEGVLNVRFDCNRGRGSWKSSGSGNLEFGPLALTRALCPTGSLHDELVRQWPYVRSYLVKDGRLFLSLMADGGTLEFEPAP